MKTSKKILSLVLALALVFSLGITAFAENTEADASGNISNTTGNGNGTAIVSVTAAAPTFSVTLPTSLSVALDGNGEGTNAALPIKNNSMVAPIKLTTIQVKDSNWVVKGYDHSFKTESVNAKMIGFDFYTGTKNTVEEGAPQTYTKSGASLGATSDSTGYSSAANVAAKTDTVGGLLSIAADTTGYILADAKAPVQTTASSADVANVILIVAWDATIDS